MVERISRELGADPVVIATGGLSSLMAGLCESIDEVEPDLTLIGLRLVHEKNV
jgi:type III pantothenate kinase